MRRVAVASLCCLVACLSSVPTRALNNSLITLAGRGSNVGPATSAYLPFPFAVVRDGGSYKYLLSCYAAGTHVLTIYGAPFAAQQVQFTIPATTTGAHLVTMIQSLTLNSLTNQYVATIRIAKGF